MEGEIPSTWETIKEIFFFFGSSTIYKQKKKKVYILHNDIVASFAFDLRVNFESS